MMLNVSLTDITNIEFDVNSTDINDTLHHMNEFLTKICQRQTAPEVINLLYLLSTNLEYLKISVNI